MGIISRLLLIILIIIFFLAIVGLGWNTVFEGVKKGADKIGITSIIENATSGITQIIVNNES
jgi:hypothetical protein